MESWKAVAVNNNYIVSDLGKIKTARFDRLRKPSLHKKSGYLQIYLHKNNIETYYAMHILIAFAFVPNPENKPCVNHINGIKTDNRAVNLEWCTHSENSLHAISTGLQKVLSGEDCSWNRPVCQYNLSGDKVADFYSIINAANITKISRYSISKNVSGENKTARGFVFKYA